MKNVLITLAHYGSKQREHLMKCLNEYNSFSENYNVVVHLLLTEDFECNFDKLKIEKHFYNPDIKDYLPLTHRRIFAENVDRFDYFLYSEDDILITEKIFDSYVETQNKLPLPFNCGFLRYEYKIGSGYKYLLDNHVAHSVHRNGTKIIKNNYLIKGENYFEVYNFHQGCYILTNDLLKHAINSTKYFELQNYYVGPLESAASDVFHKCGVIKVIPRDKVGKLVIHHLSDKYVNLLADFYTEESTPNEQKITDLQKDEEPIYV